MKASRLCCEMSDFSSLLPTLAILLLFRYLQADLLAVGLRAYNVSSEDCSQVCGLWQHLVPR